ncbi:rna-directed dna polymerase from mobile element jockey-like [Pitangus sulphuratus]|nr:rna-directed dna polymerase from mobile element jockey-like [Pitangus sulphuratus]
MPGQVTEQIILSAITRHVQDNEGISPSQCGFVKGKSCLTNLIFSFYDKMTRLVDEGKSVHIIYLDFSKAFDIISHSILEKLPAYGLDSYNLGKLSLVTLNTTPLQIPKDVEDFPKL